MFEENKKNEIFGYGPNKYAEQIGKIDRQWINNEPNHICNQNFYPADGGICDAE
jgi:hypothetical protein